MSSCTKALKSSLFLISLKLIGPLADYEVQAGFSIVRVARTACMSRIYFINMDFDDYLLSDGDDFDDSDKITDDDDDDHSLQIESLNDYPFPGLPNSLFVNNQNDHRMDDSADDDGDSKNVFETTPTAERSSKQMEITFANFQNLRREDSCDLTIVCKERKFPVHRLVLRAGSSYFEAMFTCGLQETTASVINLPAIDSNSMAIILDFLYIQKVDTHSLDFNELLDLISSSHSIQF
uniref:BTB domain-containing protein n=1 Tax=Strigamia maritima TaxID=126957 RepID=T1JP46_STRMM